MRADTCNWNVFLHYTSQSVNKSHYYTDISLTQNIAYLNDIIDSIFTPILNHSILNHDGVEDGKHFVFRLL